MDITNLPDGYTFRVEDFDKDNMKIEDSQNPIFFAVVEDGNTKLNIKLLLKMVLVMILEYKVEQLVEGFTFKFEVSLMSF